MFIAVLLKIAKGWKQLKCPQTDEWINNMHIIYYSALKREDIFIYAATRMNL